MKTALALLALLAAPAAAQPGSALSPQQGSYVSFMLRSLHVGNHSLNNNTPGITVGHLWPSARPRMDWFVEGGVFRNSFKETAPVLMAGARWDLGRLGPAEVFLAAGGGIAYYPTLAKGLKRVYHIPNADGYIPVVALSLSAQVGRMEYRVTTVPCQSDTKAIFNFSAIVHF